MSKKQKPHVRTIEEELALVQGNKSILHPEQVVEWAKRNPESALYKQFEWDDAKAGADYRVWQARRLIALHIVTPEGERKTVSLTVDRKKGGGYRQIEDVVRIPALRETMLQDALKELHRVKTKYQHLTELAGVFKQIDAVEKKYSHTEAA
jgi:hypothetical protein